jgi:pimeloyl-ACP methyl ester carboxylesterase
LISLFHGGESPGRLKHVELRSCTIQTLGFEAFWLSSKQTDIAGGQDDPRAWRSKPSWYAVSTEDRTINPDLERFMAKRMGAKTIEVKASHVSLISQPDAIANLILEAAGQT